MIAGSIPFQTTRRKITKLAILIGCTC